jgi:signal transduction histidine kinase
MSTEVELALFRVAQEAMENVRKHSDSLHAEVSLERLNGHIRLAVTDNGEGLPEVMEKGIGLAGMRERIEAVGGTMRVGNNSAGGVCVEADVPVREASGG